MRIFLNYITIIALVLNQTKYSLGDFSYVLVIINLIYSLLRTNESTKIQFDKRYLLLIVVIILSFLANSIPPVLKSDIKFYGFVVVLLFSSNLVTSNNLKSNRIELLETINKVLLFFTVFCILGLLFGYFARINENETAGGFAGIFNSSMFLAPVCAVIIIYHVHLSSLTKKIKVFNILIIGMHIYLLLLTGSRSAVFALIVAILVFIFKVYSNNVFSFIRKYWYLFILLIIFSFSINVNSIFKVFITKFEIEEKMDGNSRKTLWDNRLDEFYSSPIFGIGFNSVDLEKSNSEFSEDSGNIEPGSSWLFVLSTLGILGGTAYFLILKDFFKTLFTKNSLFANYVLSMLTFLNIHMIFEGYIFATGNIFVYIFYLTLSNLTNERTSK